MLKDPSPPLPHQGSSLFANTSTVIGGCQVWCELFPQFFYFYVSEWNVSQLHTFYNRGGRRFLEQNPKHWHWDTFNIFPLLSTVLRMQQPSLPILEGQPIQATGFEDLLSILGSWEATNLPESCLSIQAEDSKDFKGAKKLFLPLPCSCPSFLEQNIQIPMPLSPSTIQASDFEDLPSKVPGSLTSRHHECFLSAHQQLPTGNWQYWPPQHCLTI